MYITQHARQRMRLFDVPEDIVEFILTHGAHRKAKGRTMEATRGKLKVVYEPGRERRIVTVFRKGG